MSESDASEMSEMSETHDLPKKDVDEVWRTKTSGIYHTRRCAAIKNADTVLTRNREALTRHCDECDLCANESPNMRYESRCELDEIEHLADDEVCVSKTALDKKSIKTYHTKSCKFIRRYDSVFGIIKTDALPDAATECLHCARNGINDDATDADNEATGDTNTNIRPAEAVPSRYPDQVWCAGTRANGSVFHTNRDCESLRAARAIRRRDGSFVRQMRTECQHCVNGVKSNKGDSISTLAHDLHDADSIEEALSDD